MGMEAPYFIASIKWRMALKTVDKASLSCPNLPLKTNLKSNTQEANWY